MLSDMVAAYVYATTERERNRAERNCRKLGIDKRTLEFMAQVLLEEMGHSITEGRGK